MNTVDWNAFILGSRNLAPFKLPSSGGMVRENYCLRGKNIETSLVSHVTMELDIAQFGHFFTGFWLFLGHQRINEPVAEKASPL